MADNQETGLHLAGPVISGSDVAIPNLESQVGLMDLASNQSTLVQGGEIAIPDLQCQVGLANPIMDPSTSSEVLITGGDFKNAILGPQTINNHLEARNYVNPTVNEVHHHYYGRESDQEVSSSSSQQSTRSTPEETAEVLEEGFVRICEDTVMYVRDPMVKGTNIYKGYQEYAGTSDRLPVAIKRIVLSSDEHRKEVQHLVTLASHPNVVRILRSKEHKTPHIHLLYIVMELCSLQNLQDYLDENREKGTLFNFNKTMEFTKQLLNGMKYIHDNGIVHRDVKPANVLLSTDKTKLKFTDFGLGKKLRQGRTSTNVTSQGQGTMGYRAPETFSSDKVSKSADVFSLGLTIFGLWSNGDHPFGDNIHLRDANIITNKNPSFSGLIAGGTWREDFLDLMSSMLQHDPNLRPTIDGVLEHPFFTNAAREIRTGQEPRRSRCPEQVAPNQGAMNETEQIKAIIGVIDKKSKTIQAFKPKDKSWKILQNITEEISKKRWFCAIAVDRVIFVLASDCSNYKFNLSKPSEGWIELPKRSERRWIQVVELGGRVYAFHDENERSVAIEILDADHTSWRKIEKPKPSCCEAITVAKGCIYTFGGLDCSYLQRSMRFDPNTSSWMNLPDMPTARRQTAATTLAGKIYVIGGCDRKEVLNTTECFDIATQKWTTLKPMNNQRCYFNAFALDGKVYAVNSNVNLTSHPGRFVIEEYDPATDTWKDVITDYTKNIPRKATFYLRT